MPTITDGAGFRWDFDRAYLQTGLQSAIGDGSNDAFDVGLTLTIDGQGAVGQFANFVEGSRDVTYAGSVGTIGFQRELYVPSDEGWARFLESFTNNGATARTITVSILSNSGNDGNFRITGTSSGDTVFSTADHWVTNDDFSSVLSGDPRVLHYFDDGSLAPSSVGQTVFDLAGNQGVQFTHTITLQPGQTVGMMHFAAQQYGDLTDVVARLQSLDARVLAGLTPSEIGSIANFDFGPSVAASQLMPALAASDLGATIGSDDLRATANVDGHDLTYTVTAAPAGTLLIDGQVAAVGSTFTQADVDGGHVQLLAGPLKPVAAVSTPNGPISGAGVAFEDTFRFTVSDGAGGSVDGTFKAPYQSFDTVQTSSQWGGYWGGAGNDYQLGGQGADNMSGGDGHDEMIGGNGDDSLSGGAGNNRLFGQAGNDNLSGGNGDDLLDGGAGHDQLHANGGNNWVFGGAGNDTITAGEGNDTLFGGIADDLIHANGGNNAVDGGSGNDTVTTGAGNDVVIGGAGNDRINDNGGTNLFKLGGIAGAVTDGNDSFTTGGGADTFALFLNDENGGAAGWGRDTVNGFRIAQGDQLLAFSAQAGDWDDAGYLGGLVDRGFVSGTRSADGGDLTLNFGNGAGASSLTLKWFFWDNGDVLSDAERGIGFGQSIGKDNLVGILQDAVRDGGSVGVGGTDFLEQAHDYVARDFML